MSDATQEWLKSEDSREYFELLRFPTVGAETAHLRDCVQAATWLRKWLKGIGAEAELVLPKQRLSGSAAKQTPVPVVFAELKRDEGAPTALVYGHYDVQPVDPVDEWSSPPFEPTVVGDRVRCRGAQDDKGQMFAFLCGVRELVAESSLRVNLKFVLEGQEESGSGSLFSLLEDREFRRRIAADVLLVSDTGAAADLRPAIVAGLRGVCHFTARLTAAARDLHSGEYGGVAPNAAQGMAELLASLHGPDGAIAVAGFRDGIAPPTSEELAKAEEAYATSGGSVEAFSRDIGCEPCGGERGRSPAERCAFEPTIEVNGVHSGYGGPGSKTVIPREAVAKLSMRLVPGQSPKHAFEAVKAHLAGHCPEGMTLEFPEDSGLSAAIRLPLASPIFRLAEDVLAGMDPRGPAFVWDGASIPVVSALREATCAAPLLVGWGQPEDRIHSPDESFSVRQFLLAKDWAKRILTALPQ